MQNDKSITGNKGEDIAVNFLQNKNFEVVEKNYRYGHGEIDIICKKDNLLIFVEVKTRKNLEFGYPELAVTKTKQKQIRKIAQAYLVDKDITNIDCRIDVVAILLKRNLPPEINHIENAF